MVSRHDSSLLLLLLLLSLSHYGVHSAKTVLTPSQRRAREERIKQLEQHRKLQNDKQNDKDNDNDNKNNGKDAEPQTAPPALQPTPEPTLWFGQPTPEPTPRFGFSILTPEPTPNPTERPTLAPVQAPRTPVPTESADDEVPPTNSVRLSAEEIQEIQYFGGAEVTVRLSLWFEDGSSANQLGGGAVEEAMLASLHSLICQSPEAMGADTDSMVFDTLFDDTNNNPEDRELCVVDTELWVRQVSATVEGSILFQPPTTYVVDRTASDSGLRWTTWRVTWDVLRLGTSYIAQGLENAGPDASELSQAQIYRAGVEAMQGILDLALQVSIREQSYDKLIVAALGVAGEERSMVLSSVYGEEVATFVPKIEWLGLADVTPTTNNDPPGGEGADYNVVYPTTTAPPNVQVVETADDAEEDDDEYDDDRYSDVYGITEPIDPPFWHPLRIVGIVMFFLTSACLVFLSCMSKKRQARRTRERKMAKEGLLNNRQGVEDMLRESQAMPSKTYTKSEDEGLEIPMPKNLQKH